MMNELHSLQSGVPACVVHDMLSSTRVQPAVADRVATTQLPTELPTAESNTAVRVATMA